MNLKPEISSLLSKHRIKYEAINSVCFTVIYKTFKNSNKISVFVFKDKIKIALCDARDTIIKVEDFIGLINIPIKINEYKKINETLTDKVNF